jgi:Cu/Ag efflux pump CusA
MKVVAPRGLGGQAIMAWKDSRVNLARMGCGTLVPLVTFVSLEATGRVLDLSALIVLLMLRGIVVTNTIVLLDLAQHTIEAGGDVRTLLIQGDRTHAHPILMRGRVGTWPAGSYSWPGRR